ncbi:hypothetical protein ACJMCD_28620 (plasmid) [Priestia megaterium]|uniref:Cap15 family cyclic dinucleotide receptor domain-containing protein n=1 Tax=Priestia megaterium TaxID=1404 RepID=UPI00389A8D92
MHEYSIDTKREVIVFVLASLSIALSTLINKLITAENLEFLSKFSITGFAIFGLLYVLFNNFIWKWGFLYKVGLIKTPNLNGVWVGSFQSSYHKWEKDFPAKIEIKQTWTHICIKGTFNDSTSESNTASLKVNSGGIKLFYSYYNDTNPESSDSSFTNHRGYASFEFILKEKKVQGRYFNDPANNKNHGKIKLKQSV